MSWFSILPAGLSTLETWAIRIFLILGALTIGPWLLAIAYDILLYIWRSATYELPIVGGRARGKQRPRAPSLAERPRPRALSIAAGLATGVEDMVTPEGVRTRKSDADDQGDGVGTKG
ncbi:hypothetical protein FGG08_004109 [Glutinoglossum americanum]|uniref:Uncharacterized protein n=1 Tax=Glutinoglossum americanum TaxID=1670608 RepID=A0A9P8L317_9PEZI|nr:hypothetical protein FGG08_004109 [Glutinoglossum americanum]